MSDDSIGLTTGPLANDPDTVARGIDAMPSSLADHFYGEAAESLGAGARAVGEEFARSGVDPENGYPVMPPEANISADDANAKYGIEGDGGLKFDNPVPDSVAASMYQAKLDANMRASVMQRQPSGVFNSVAGFGLDTAANMLDPLNAATAFIPILGEARYASWAARAAYRFTVGGAQMAVAQAPGVLARLALSKSEQGDMTAADALTDLAYGAAFGGALHSIGGAVGDAVHGAPSTPQVRAVETAPPEIQQAALRTSIAALAEGRPVDVMPYFGLNDMRLMSREADLREQAAQLDQFIADLDVHPNAAAASDTLARLDTIESQLGDESIAPEQRAALAQRRDELLDGQNTTPETLQEQAAGLDIQRQAQAQRDNIGAMLDDIAQRRAAGAADAALPPLPKLQDDPRFQQAARYASGTEPLPEDAAISSMADNALKSEPSGIDKEISELEAMVQHGQSTGQLPPVIPELDAVNAGVTRAEAMKRGIAQAAICLGRAGA